MRRGGFACAVLVVLVALVVAGSGYAAISAFTARVSGLPEVQGVGRSYLFTITVKNQGAWIKNFCIDFEDDNNSWLIKMPGLRAYDDDTYCVRVLRGGSKQFVARLVPARTGQHKLTVYLGKATLIPATNGAVIDDKNALEWSDSFVIVG